MSVSVRLIVVLVLMPLSGLAQTAVKGRDSRTIDESKKSESHSSESTGKEEKPKHAQPVIRPERQISSGSILIMAVAAAVVLGVAGVVWSRRRGRRAPSFAVAESAACRAMEQPSQENQPATAIPSTSPTSIFISYRREDSADICGRVCDRLIQRFGRDSVFEDVHSIPLGYNFKEHIQTAVGRCHFLLAVIGRNWCNAIDEAGRRRLENPDDFVRTEIEAALNRDILVIPVLVQGASMPTAEMLPESLRSLAYRHGLSVRPDPDFDFDMDRLLHGIEMGLARTAGA